MTNEELMDLMEERALGYRFLSRAFRTAPDAALIDAVLRMADAERADDDPLAPFYAEAADADAETLRIDLAADYNQLFLGMDAHPVAPYESVYTSDEGLMMQEAATNVCALTAVGPARTVASTFPKTTSPWSLSSWPAWPTAPARPWAQAAAEHEPDDSAQKGGGSADELIAAQRCVLDEHLSWVPAFCRDVEKRARTAFYYGIASLTRQQLEADGAMLKEL